MYWNWKYSPIPALSKYNELYIKVPLSEKEIGIIYSHLIRLGEAYFGILPGMKWINYFNHPKILLMKLGAYQVFAFNKIKGYLID